MLDQVFKENLIANTCGSLFVAVPMLLKVLNFVISFGMAFVCMVCRVRKLAVAAVAIGLSAPFLFDPAGVCFAYKGGNSSPNLVLAAFAPFPLYFLFGNLVVFLLLLRRRMSLKNKNQKGEPNQS